MHSGFLQELVRLSGESVVQFFHLYFVSLVMRGRIPRLETAGLMEVPRILKHRVTEVAEMAGAGISVASVFRFRSPVIRSCRPRITRPNGNEDFLTTDFADYSDGCILGVRKMIWVTMIRSTERRLHARGVAGIRGLPLRMTGWHDILYSPSVAAHAGGILEAATVIDSLVCGLLYLIPTNIRLVDDRAGFDHSRELMTCF